MKVSMQALGILEYARSTYQTLSNKTNESGMGRILTHGFSLFCFDRYCKYFRARGTAMASVREAI